MHLVFYADNLHKLLDISTFCTPGRSALPERTGEEGDRCRTRVPQPMVASLGIRSQDCASRLLCNVHKLLDISTFCTPAAQRYQSAPGKKGIDAEPGVPRPMVASLRFGDAQSRLKL